MSEYDEIDAMKKIAAALEPLEDAARLRALQWAFSKYRGGGKAEAAPVALHVGAAERPHNGAPSFQSFAELFDATHPVSERDKALIAAYWIQVCQNTDSFPSQSLNDELKDLGYGVANITDALTQLKESRPALALQLKKSGTSKQARKIYKLTLEGIKRVESMLQGEL